MTIRRELTVEKWHKRLMLIGEAIGVDDETAEQMSREHGQVVGEVLFARSWSGSGMQVYEFDADFSESILAESWSELLPDVIQHAPHDCFYMKLPSNRLVEGVLVTICEPSDVIGFYEHLLDAYEASLSKGVYPVDGAHLITLVNTGSELLYVNGFAIAKTMDLMDDDTPIEVYDRTLMLNGIAYICSKNADINTVYRPPRNARPNPKKRRSSATWHEVGYRIGAELREYDRAVSRRGEHQGGSVRPHMRRAHWHHYWTGPRNGQRDLVLKWIAPTIVGAGNGEIESATGHRVRTRRTEAM